MLFDYFALFLKLYERCDKTNGAFEVKIMWTYCLGVTCLSFRRFKGVEEGTKWREVLAKISTILVPFLTITVSELEDYAIRFVALTFKFLS